MADMNPSLLTHLATAISATTQHPFALRSTTPVGGGSINESYRLEATDGARYFLKLNAARHHRMFVAEAAGLAAIAATVPSRSRAPSRTA